MATSSRRHTCRIATTDNGSEFFKTLKTGTTTQTMWRGNVPHLAPSKYSSSGKPKKEGIQEDAFPAVGDGHRRSGSGPNGK